MRSQRSIVVGQHCGSVWVEVRGGRTEFIRLLIDVLVNCIFCT